MEEWATIRPEGFLPPLLPHAGTNVNAIRRTGENLHRTCYKVRMRLHDYVPRPAHLKWLLDSDPAIRWQVMRDLTGEAPQRDCNRAVSRRNRRLGSPTSRPPISCWQLGREPPRVERRFAEGGPRLAYYPLQSRRLDGPRSRPRQQGGSQNDRPRRQAARV